MVVGEVSVPSNVKGFAGLDIIGLVRSGGSVSSVGLMGLMGLMGSVGLMGIS